MTHAPWRASFHGGHSWPFCDHAKGDLHNMIEAAIEQGMQVFGVTEHAPRLDARFLYPDEIEWGWTVQTLEEKFDAYFERLDELIQVFASDIEILRGFEIEVVPSPEWVDITRAYRERYNVEYVVGSVHYTHGLSIDSFIEPFEQAMAKVGGLESLACAYYEQVANMVFECEPEIVGHLDLIRKFGDNYGAVDTPAIRSAARTALQEIKLRNGILDLNTSPYRRGQSVPYPAPWLVEEAKTLGIPFTFGDDSHDVPDINNGIDRGRAYLLQHDIDHVTHLRRDPQNPNAALQRHAVSIAYTQEEQEKIAWQQAQAKATTSSKLPASK